MEEHEERKAKFLIWKKSMEEVFRDKLEKHRKIRSQNVEVVVKKFDKQQEPDEDRN